MKCQYCNAEIPDDAAFCPECGKGQQKEETAEKAETEEVNSYCPKCGYRLEAGTAFCPECGSRTDGRTESQNQQQPVPPVPNPQPPKGKGPVIILIFILIAAAIVVSVVFAVRSLLFGGRDGEPEILDSTEIQNYLSEEYSDDSEEMEDIDLSEVDYNLLENADLSLEGLLKTAKNGGKVLQWSEALTFYGVNEAGERVLMKDTKNAYIDDTVIPDGLLDSISGNKQISIEGSLYFSENNLYITPLYIYDSNGKDLVQAFFDSKNEAKALNNSSDYILPQSSSRLLTSSDISGLSLQEINYAKNEVYARHGRRFKSAELQNYFNSKSWYSGTIDPDSFSESILSDVEKKNVEYLKEIEFGMAPGGYQLDAH